MIRDTNTMALLNNDVDALNKYKEQRKQNSAIRTLTKEINDLRKLVETLQARLEKLEER